MSRKRASLAVGYSDVLLALQYRQQTNLAWLMRCLLFNLPLIEAPITSMRTYGGIPAVFEDVLPDDWGRRLLVKQYKLNRQQQLTPYLLDYMKGNQLGALSFTHNHEVTPLKAEQANIIKLNIT